MYLLDTSVFSQPLKRRPIQAVIERWALAGNRAVAISIVTEAEILFGIYADKASHRKDFFLQKLRPEVEIFSIDHQIADTFARMKARQRQTGQMVADFDLLIAATAKAHDLIIATLNHKDFSRIEGIRWEDWSV